MTITLVNRSGRCLSLNLPHAHVCTAGECLCSTTERRPPRRICQSITLPAGHAVTGLSVAVLAAPELRGAVARGELDVRRLEPKTPVEPPAGDSRERTKRASRKKEGPR